MQVEHQMQFRLTLTILLGVPSISYYGLTNDWNIYQIAALLSALMCGIFWVAFLQVLLTTNDLCQVTVKHRQSSMISSLYVVASVTRNESQPADSISSLVGIRGSNIEKVNTVVCNTNVGLVSACLLTYISTNYQRNKLDYNVYDDLDAVLGLIAMVGYYTASTWQLNYVSRFSTFMHYIGAALTGCINIGYGFQRNWDALACCSVVFALLCCTAWFNVTQAMAGRKDISLYCRSLANIGFESLLFFSAQVQTSLLLYNL
eukprot:684357_1